MTNYLTATYFYDTEHREIQQFLDTLELKNGSPTETAIQIFYAVRDGWLYNPYQLHFKKERWKASAIIQREFGHCLDKSIILITCLRARGIPARLHLAKVKNHIAVDRMVQRFGIHELTPHGYTEIYLNEKWVAATPAFNKSLCDKLNVTALEFDGEQDAVFQQFDRAGHQFMEYLEDYGTFEDFPIDFVRQNLMDHYAHLKSYFERGEAWGM